MNLLRKLQQSEKKYRFIGRELPAFQSIEKLLRSAFYVFVIILMVSALREASASAESVETLEASVAFLQIENKSKHPEANKTDTVSIAGTGFFVSDGSYLFLVTAGHIAEQMGSESELKIGTEDNKLFSTKISKLYGKSGEVKAKSNGYIMIRRMLQYYL